MAAKKKVEKVVTSYKCINCRKIKESSQYYKGTTICKSCIKTLATDKTTKNITQDGVEKVMEIMNKPFVKDIYVRVASMDKTTNNNFIGEYLRQINLTKDYREGTYADSVLFNMRNEKLMNAKVQIEKEEEYEKEQDEVTEDMRFFWTRGIADIPDREVLILQKMYDQYTNSGDATIITSHKVQEDFKSLCKYELQKSKIEYNLEEIKSVQMLQKMIDDLSESLGIQAIQKQSKFDNNKFTLGLITRYKEDVRKEPIPRWCEDLGHYNAMKDLVKVHYQGGMAIASGVSSKGIEEAKARLKEFEVDLKNIEE